MLKSLGLTFFKFFIAIAILGANLNCSDKGSPLEEDTTAAEEMETPEEEVDTPEDPIVPEDDTTPEETSGTAKIPADLMANCAQWKITYPDGAEDKTLCDEDNNEYFYVNDDKNGIVFKAPIRSTNNTTTNSTYIRSELRERTEDGTADIYWTTTGTHVVYVKQAFTHLPINKSHVVGTQIHGDKEAGIDDAMVLRLEDSHLFLSFNGGVLRSDLTIKTDYTLGTSHEVIFEVKDGKHYCYYSEDGALRASYENGTASEYLVLDGDSTVLMDKDYDQSYFKIGNYTQSNSEKEGSDTDDPLNYGEVVVYDFFAKHL
ncbi:polysaccharide lyase family 7 protein [Cellulophaga sp. E16_2]|uniref:polysaccharide lyase family 7 protein n=1 Tax=Cellulophaga sp. E16_2 TaxID=2789297 RepID=UPI001A91F343|nr:polysaccharide lyase family 7 protein [Cellulophaga sp. E16_2]MBO0592578.1 polysaccharide lyase family 7 protein [Cellulophaga sp. E16_2]